MNREQINLFFLQAQKERRAIPAFNFNNLECLKAIIEAAEEEQYVVIAQVTESAAKYIGFDFVKAIAKAARNSKYVILHWDHGFDYLIAQTMVQSKCFNSVMHDSSLFPWETNVEHTQKMVKLGLENDVWIEAEIGKIGGKEDDHESDSTSQTTVQEAKSFVQLCSPDMLAIAVGTAHGYYNGEIKINVDLIKEISSAIPKTFLVLHGGSGIPNEIIKNCIDNGIVKLNIGTEVAHAYYNGLTEWINKNPNNFDSRKFNRHAIDKTKEIIKSKITLCRNKK
ncbi:MAG: class II fructose-bisphosphate aldolase [Malacoplasma sp.]